MKAAFQNAFEAYVKTIMETYGAVGMAVTAIDAQRRFTAAFSAGQIYNGSSLSMKIRFLGWLR